MSQFMACHETGSRRPRLIPIREVAKVEPQGPQGAAWAIFSPATITLRSGERVQVIEAPATVLDMTGRVPTED